MKKKIVNVLGMELERWKHKSCVAFFGIGEDWATLYKIESEKKNSGHATELLIGAKKHYEGLGKKFGGSVALSPAMKYLYKKLNIPEYNF